MEESKVDCVFVDEAQFLTAEQVWQLARVADRLDVPVMCFGLRTDFQGKLFPGSSELLAIADELREIRTICFCGRKATMVVRRGADGGVLTEGNQVSIEKSVYVSLCRRHWEEEIGRWPPKGPSPMRTETLQPGAPSPRAPSPSAPSPCPPTPTRPATFSAAG